MISDIFPPQIDNGGPLDGFFSVSSLKKLVTCRENSCYDKTHGFVMKNTQTSSNVTKDHHLGGSN